MTGAADAIIMPAQIRKSVNGMAISIERSILKHGLRRVVIVFNKLPPGKSTRYDEGNNLNERNRDFMPTTDLSFGFRGFLSFEGVEISYTEVSE